jgi:hypothetical protein
MKHTPTPFLLPFGAGCLLPFGAADMMWVAEG